MIAETRQTTESTELAARRHSIDMTNTPERNCSGNWSIDSRSEARQQIENANRICDCRSDLRVSRGKRLLIRCDAGFSSTLLVQSDSEFSLQTSNASLAPCEPRVNQNRGIFAARRMSRITRDAFDTSTLTNCTKLRRGN